MNIKRGIEGKFKNIIFRKGAPIVLGGVQAGLGIFGGNIAVPVEAISNTKEEEITTSIYDFYEGDTPSEVAYNEMFYEEEKNNPEDLVYNLVLEGKITEEEFNYLLYISHSSCTKDNYTFDKLKEGKYFFSTDKAIDNLEFLKYTNIDTIMISNCKDYSYLKQLTNLKSIIFENSNVSNADINYLPSSVESIQIREGCNNLTVLNNLKTLCPNLTDLYVKSTEITKLGALPSSLQELDISGTKVEDISHLANDCPNLEVVYVSDCPKINSIYSLTKLNNLKKCYISGTADMSNRHYVNVCLNFNQKAETDIPISMSETFYFSENDDMIKKATDDGKTIKEYKDEDLIFNKNIFPESVLTYLSETVGRNVEEITFGDLKYVGKLEIQSDMQNLDFVYYIPNLTRLNVVAPISDISSLKYTKIESVSLKYPVIDDNQLANLPLNINSLYLYRGMFVEDLSVLSIYPNLENLNINQCMNIKSLDFVKSMTNLKTLKADELPCIDQNTLDMINSLNIQHNLNEDDVLNNQKIKEILNSIIDDQMTKKQKLDAIIKYVNKSMDYTKFKTQEEQTKVLTHSLNGEGVCIGYSVLTHVLLKEAGLDSYIYIGLNTDETPGHALNVVELYGKTMMVSAQGISDDYTEKFSDYDGYEIIVLPPQIIKKLRFQENIDNTKPYVIPIAIGGGVAVLVGSVLYIKKRKYTDNLNDESVIDINEDSEHRVQR